jgi:hypothetical protein
VLADIPRLGIRGGAGTGKSLVARLHVPLAVRRPREARGPRASRGADGVRGAGVLAGRGTQEVDDGARPVARRAL